MPPARSTPSATSLELHHCAIASLYPTPLPRFSCAKSGAQPPQGNLTSAVIVRAASKSVYPQCTKRDSNRRNALLTFLAFVWNALHTHAVQSAGHSNYTAFAECMVAFKEETYQP